MLFQSFIQNKNKRIVHTAFTACPILLLPMFYSIEHARVGLLP